MPDTRETLVRRMIDEGTSDDDILATLKVFDAQPLSAPARPFAAEDFMTPDQIRNADSNRGWPATLWEIAKGGVKGLGSSALGVAKMAAQSGALGIPTTAADSAVFQAADEALTPENMPQRVGKLGEFALETAIPAAKVATAIPTAVKALPKVLVPAARSVAEHGVYGAARKGLANAFIEMLEGSPNAGGKLVKTKAPTVEEAIADALQNQPKELPQSVELPPAAELPPGYEPRTTVPQPKPSANAGGRLVRDKGPSVEAAMSDVLSELKAAEPPARITTPPERGLPPGYTPRTTTPKVRQMPRPAAPEPAGEAPAPKRLYFLKSPEDMAPRAASEAVEPSDFTDQTQLPASWRSRMDQPVTRVTNAEVEELANGLAERGLSPSDALKAVTRNAQLAPEMRIQLMTALGRLMKGAR